MKITINFKIPLRFVPMGLMDDKSLFTQWLDAEQVTIHPDDE